MFIIDYYNRCFSLPYFVLQWPNKLSYPQSGPPLARSKTWCGFNSFLKLVMRCTPWPPPLLTLTKTSKGQTLGGNMDGFKVGSSITKIENTDKLLKISNGQNQMPGITSSSLVNLT